MAVLSDISSIGKQLTDTLVRLHLWMEYEGTHGVQTLNFIQEAKKKKGVGQISLSSAITGIPQPLG